MNYYEVGFEGQRETIMAESLYHAKLKAIELFKPSKRKANLVWVLLVKVGEREVVHSTCEL